MNNPPRNESVQVGLHVLNYPIRVWDLLLNHEIKGVWKPGALMKNAMDNQFWGIETFRNIAPGIIETANDKDLVNDAKRRRVLEQLNRLLDEAHTRLEIMNADLQQMAELAPQFLTSVSPLRDSDMVGELRDQELRRVMREMAVGDRRDLMAKMIDGQHPALVAAALRAADPMLAGLDAAQTRRLNAAGIAAEHGEHILALRVMVEAFEDARVTMYRSLVGLAGIGSLRVTNSDLGRRLNAEFLPHSAVNELREWLKSIPVEVTAQRSEAA